MHNQLFDAIDVLDGIQIKLKLLYTEYALDVENAELDGSDPPALDAKAIAQLKSLAIALNSVASDINKIVKEVLAPREIDLTEPMVVMQSVDVTDEMIEDNDIPF